MILVVFLRLPAGFPTLPDLFEGLCFCSGVSVDRYIPVWLLNRSTELKSLGNRAGQLGLIQGPSECGFRSKQVENCRYPVPHPSPLPHRNTLMHSAGAMATDMAGPAVSNETVHPTTRKEFVRVCAIRVVQRPRLCRGMGIGERRVSISCGRNPHINPS